MTALQAVVLTLLLVLGLATVLSYDPRRQAIVNGFFGLALTLLFAVLSAPDVAISAIVVSAGAFPAVTLIAVNRARDRAQDRHKEGSGG